MQIVIDIPKNLYKHIQNDNEYYHEDGECLYTIVKNGTPLPKGHGRLIDADELKTLSYEVFVDTDNPNRLDGLSVCNGLVEDDIDLAPTIIEADAESEEEE